MSCFHSLGLLDPNAPQGYQISKHMTWNTFIKKVLKVDSDDGVIKAVEKKLGVERNEALKQTCVESLKWLGIIGNDSAIGANFDSPLDALCSTMSSKVL